MCAFTVAACGGGGGGGTDPKVVATLALSPSVIDTLFSRGMTVQLNVQAKDAAGNVISGPSLSFTSGNQSIATVTSAGVITSQGDGKTNITVASGTVSQAVEVKVRRKVASITLTPTTRTLAPNATQVLTVRAFDALNNEIPGGVTPTFVSSNTAVATVNGAGTVTALANGTTTITATAVTVDGTRTANSEITVAVQSFPNQASVTIGASSFNPDIVDITAGGSVTWTNNSSGTLHNVTFATLTANNIAEHTTGSNTRSFNSAGSFAYQCTLHGGMTGTVIVH
jgi:plastocyanin